MAETTELVCEDEGWLVEDTEVTGLALEVGGVIWLVEEVELMAVIAGGGGRPGVDLIGGGRRGRGFIFEGLKKNPKQNREQSLMTLLIYDEFEDKKT